MFVYDIVQEEKNILGPETLKYKFISLLAFSDPLRVLRVRYANHGGVPKCAGVIPVFSIVNSSFTG